MKRLEIVTFSHLNNSTVASVITHTDSHNIVVALLCVSLSPVLVLIWSLAKRSRFVRLSLIKSPCMQSVHNR